MLALPLYQGLANPVQVDVRQVGDDEIRGGEVHSGGDRIEGDYREESGGFSSGETVGGVFDSDGLCRIGAKAATRFQVEIGEGLCALHVVGTDHGRERVGDPSA